jgi:hypothetical protein
VRIKLASEYPQEVNLQEPLDENMYDIRPGVEGDVFWVDKRTLEFRPGKPLPSGEDFEMKLDLSRLLGKKGSEDFVFGFSTIPLNLDIDFTGLKTYSNTDLKWNRIEGKIFISDVIAISDLEKILVASQDGRSLRIDWDHESATEHSFIIDSVERKKTGEKVEVSWNGKPVDINIEGSREFIIPALGEFVFMEYKIVQHPDQYVSLLFSDPLEPDQDLEGLVGLENNTHLRFSVMDNEIRIFPNVRQHGKINLRIEPGIRNILGYKFKETQSLSLNFEDMKPGVRLIGEGVIIPGSDGLLFPFEAVNLKAVDVKVIKIYENNIAQFLQVNSLEGNSQLKRAGRLILKKRVDLIPERPINFGEWNAFSLDLTNLIIPDPGAIYRIELSFRKKYSLYPCDNAEEENLTEPEDDFEIMSDSELAYWDATHGHYDYNYSYRRYNYYEKDDPCTDSYYNYPGRKVARNILASNIGLIAKRGNGNSILFAASNLVTTEALGGVKIDVYNFQNQILASLTTNSEGIAKTELGSEPYLAIASLKDQKAYLRIDRGSSLSLSQFDISGAQTRKGIKGFIYGERGVWRPGDSIYTTFILEDSDNNLPQNHPVSFELYDPRGKLRKTNTLTEGNHGFYSFHTATHPEDPTGMWNLKVQVGGASFHKSLRIETVKPNRLKINLDFGEEMILSGTDRLKGNLDVDWLHGAPAGDLRVKVDVNFQTRPTEFEGYEKYTFTDHSRRFSSREKLIFDGQLDASGEASFQPSFNLSNKAPGMLKAIFTTRAFEKGGNFSINRISIPYSPYPVYCGLKKPEGNVYGMLQTDSLYTFDIVSLNESGEPVSQENLEVIIYKLQWRWWWHSASENLASYTGNPSQKPIFSTRLNTSEDGKGSFDFRIDYPEWGRFLVVVKDPDGRHSCSQTVYFDWPGWAGRASRNDPNSARILPFSSDKSSYNVGESAEITIPTSSEGRIFLSIENGNKVLDHYWLQASGGETSFNFTITPEMAPNIYVHVTHIQPHNQSTNDLPIRMYGVIPVFVEDPATRLSPEINMPGVLKPESTLTVGVSEKNDREMVYTLAIVDEGLLDLTGFRTPDPWKAFYAREALGVSTFDFYDNVLGAFGGRIDGVFSIGGDMEMDQAARPERRANRFPPMVRYEGPFHLKKGKENKHTIKVPNYVGSVRAMVIAGFEGAYGTTEKTVPVRKPLMVLSTLPRVLSPGEAVSLPVTVFAMEDQIREVQIEVESNELFSSEVLKKNITFSQTGEENVFFNLQVGEKTGIGKIRVNAKSGSEKAFHEIELEVRSPNPEVTEFLYTQIEPGESWSKEIVLPGIAGTNSSVLEAFSIPPFDFGRRLKSLLRYPHGCIEQTTSTAFPQLYLADIMDVNEKMLEMTEGNIKAAIDRLGSFQLASGGFSYWPQATAENDWGTSYVGHFFLKAKEKGYKVPQRWIDKWIKYQRKTARRWTGSSYESEWHRRALFMSQAYRLYTLALAGEHEMGAMNRLREKNNTGMASWHLIAAYALAGKEDIAIEMSEEMNMDTPSYQTGHFYTYGSSIRDKAIILETMTLIDRKETAIPLLRQISEQLSSQRWLSTQSTAYCLMAISEYLSDNNTSDKVSFDYKWDSDEFVHAETSHPVANIYREQEDQETTNIEVQNRGESTLYIRIANTGIPLAGEEQASSNNLRMSVEYQDMDGNRLDVSELKQGTDFIAIVNVANPGTLGYYSDLALTQIFPSGWEIQNMRMFGSSIGSFDRPMYQDIRDDRIYSYFNLSVFNPVRFGVKLTATYAGDFYLPGISCDAMYREDIQAVVPGQWVKVSRPGE